MRGLFRNKWVKIGLIVLAVLMVVALVGMAWNGGKNSQVSQQKTGTTAKPVTPVPPKDYSNDFKELKDMVANLSKPVSPIPQPQPPQPVTVTVNPPVVNVTVTQTMNGTKSESQSSSKTTLVYPSGIGFEGLKGLVYNGNFNEYKGTLDDGSAVDHTWWSGGPFGLNRFSVKWRGSVVIEESGRYRFSVFSDDRVRLEVGNQRLIDKWVSGQSA